MESLQSDAHDVRKIVTPKEFWESTRNPNLNGEARIYLFDAFGTLFRKPTYNEKQRAKLQKEGYIARALTKPLGSQDTKAFQSAVNSIDTLEGIILLKNLNGPKYVVSDLASPFATPVLAETKQYQGHFFSFEMGVVKSPEFYKRVLETIQIRNGKRAQVMLISDHKERDIDFAKQAGIEQTIWIHQDGTAHSLKEAYGVLYEDSELVRNLGVGLTNRLYSKMGILEAQKWFTEYEFLPHTTPKQLCADGANHIIDDYVRNLNE
jgi:hypothetical protein